VPTFRLLSNTAKAIGYPKLTVTNAAVSNFTGSACAPRVLLSTLSTLCSATPMCVEGPGGLV
jgi:hypothetical protein